MSLQETLRHICNCGTPLKLNEKFCDHCRPIAYAKTKVKAQLRWLNKTAKNGTCYRSINEEFRESCKLRDFIKYHADELQVGDSI